MENVNWSQYYKPSANLNLQGNPALDDLRQTYHQREQQRLQDNADLTKEMAKLNFNGSRDAEHPQLQGDYAKILQKFADIRNVNDPKERAAKDLELRQMQNQFMYNASESKERGIKEQQLHNLTLQPNVDLADGVPQKIQALTKIQDPKEWNKAYNDLGQNLFAPKFDEIKASEEIAKPLIKDGQPIVSSHVDPQTGEKIVSRSTPQVLDHDQFVNGYINNNKNNHSAVRMAVQSTGEQDPAKALLTRAEQLYNYHKAGLKDKVDKPEKMGETLATKEALLRYGAQVKQQYPSGEAGKVTPFQTTAASVQKAAETDERTAEKLLKPILDQIPTKGMQGNIHYSIKDGTLNIDMPRKGHGNSAVDAHRVQVDIADPHFSDILQAKLHQEGIDVNGYNQAFRGKQVPKEANTPNEYKIKGKTYKSDAVEKAAKASGMSVDEYIKAVNNQ